MNMQRSRAARRSRRVSSGSRKQRQTRTDILIIGGGVAGLRAAIAASEFGRVVILTGPERIHANTLLSQGGIAVSVGDGDSPDMHLADTLAAGDGLCDERAARFIIERGRARLGELLEWGLRIHRDPDGTPSLGLEGGHGARRIVRVRGDSIGFELYRVLVSRARRQRAISFVNGWSALDILTTDDRHGQRRAAGAIMHHPVGGLRMIHARGTILATGGAAGLYARSTNPQGVTGDGIAMALRAGAALRGMEFVQFHPTALDVPASPRPLISEAVRGEGALLLDGRGRRIMGGVHSLAELAPRDIVSRTIASLQSNEGTRCFLDARTIHDFKNRFATIATVLHRHGIDPSNQLIPISPAAHYLVGGVVTDQFGRTSLPGLYAAGEVASTGLHGANRLAGNSLLEGLVMGQAAGQSAGQAAAELDSSDRVESAECPCMYHNARLRDLAEIDLLTEATARALRELMWNHLGILRHAWGLRQAAAQLRAWQEALSGHNWRDPLAWKLRNMLTVATIITQAALARDQSAGCHYRTDEPLAARGADRAPFTSFASTTRSSHA